MEEHWRNAMKPMRFLFLDVRVALFVFICLVHFRTYTVVLTVFMILFFWILEWRGLTFNASLRSIRLWIAGNYRPAVRQTGRQYWVDYGAGQPPGHQ
ncbi:MAG: type IV secretion protein IcmT [Alphaproteobacteria bacterium]|nr:MAG: type IV secretion protein IcmT [Alphaproteobacteria bacterium]